MLYIGHFNYQLVRPGMVPKALKRRITLIIKEVTKNNQFSLVVDNTKKTNSSKAFYNALRGLSKLNTKMQADEQKPTALHEEISREYKAQGIDRSPEEVRELTT